MSDIRDQSGTQGQSNSSLAELVNYVLSARSPGSRVSTNSVVPAEKRKAERIIVNMQGSISFRLGSIVMPCLVQDVSATGARLRVENVNLVPSPFRLAVSNDNVTAECVIVWRAASEVGVIFQSAQW